MEQVLHLFITNRCRHNCPLCCNKFYKIDEIPVVTVELLKSVQTICLTGGEPFSIVKDQLHPFIENIRAQYSNIENLYIYTSGKEFGMSIHEYTDLIQRKCIDGINVAPKDWEDWYWFAKVATKGAQYIFPYENSNRLYVFKEQKPIFEAANICLGFCNIKIIDRQWTSSFNTPSNEHFARLPILF